MAALGFRAVTGMVLVGALFSSTSNAQQACDRACLTKVVDGYFAALIANDAEDVEPDNAGRLLISPVLRSYARITRQVMFVGQGSHFEIWDLEQWNAQLEALRSGGSPQLPPGMESFSL